MEVIIKVGLMLVVVSTSFYAGMKWERFCQNVGKHIKTA